VFFETFPFNISERKYGRIVRSSLSRMGLPLKQSMHIGSSATMRVALTFLPVRRKCGAQIIVLPFERKGPTLKDCVFFVGPSPLETAQGSTARVITHKQ